MKSGYASIKDGIVDKVNMRTSSSYSHSELSWKVISNAKVPERIKKFTWRIKNNVLATRNNLAMMRIGKDSVCMMCEKAKETIEHMLLLCPWISSIWFGLQLNSVPTTYSLTVVTVVPM